MYLYTPLYSCNIKPADSTTYLNKYNIINIRLKNNRNNKKKKFTK